MSPEYASISVQKAKNTSAYSSIRQGRCKIDLCAVDAPIGLDSMLSQSGKQSIKQKHKSVDYCIRQESWAGAKRKDITMPTTILVESPSFGYVRQTKCSCCA
jgi:hypothetical protein